MLSSDHVFPWPGPRIIYFLYDYDYKLKGDRLVNCVLSTFTVPVMDLFWGHN